MVRKHTRRAAKAAYAVSLGVAIVIGLIAAGAGTASPAAKPTVIIGTKNFTEQYILGQLYKQALEAKGYTVDYKENIGSSEIIVNQASYGLAGVVGASFCVSALTLAAALLLSLLLRAASPRPQPKA